MRGGEGGEEREERGGRRGEGRTGEVERGQGRGGGGKEFQVKLDRMGYSWMCDHLCIASC